MLHENNPQAQQMADESMVRNLSAQAEAIWPQEQLLFNRYALPEQARILDVGCGTGEISSRLALRFPQAQVSGVDLLAGPLDIASQRFASLAPRLDFQRQDAFHLEHAADSFDLLVCRHMLQAVPQPELAMKEFVRVIKPGAFLHLINEDYTMLHMQIGQLDPDRLWRDGAVRFLGNTGTDGRIGRHTFGALQGLGLLEIQIEYLTIDTLRVPRDTFANIMRAWRDGYSRVISEHTELQRGEVDELFEQVINTVLDPQQYAVWHVPVICARKPG